MVYRVDREATWNEEIYDVGVAPAVLAVAMGHQQGGASLIVRQPVLVVDFDTALACEGAI